MRMLMLGGIVVCTLAGCTTNTHPDGGDADGGTGDSGAIAGASGSATGGNATSGNATGGNATGGNATGGNATSGNATGVCTSTLNAGGRTGAATITYMKQTMTLPERACETLRGPNGVPFGWAAYYGAPLTKQVTERQYPAFAVIVSRAFVGDGSYESGDYVRNHSAVEWFLKLGEVGSATASPSALVVANGAKSAVLDVADVIHAELSCDPTDDTGTNSIGAVDANAAPPGSAYLVDGYGALHKFDCARCSEFVNKLSLNAPSVAPDYDSGGYGSHTFFSLSSNSGADVSAKGSYQFEGHFGWRFGSSYFTAMVDVTTVKPAAGTFTVPGTDDPMSGSFRCPSDAF